MRPRFAEKNDHLLYFPIPPGVSKEDVLHSPGLFKDVLYGLVNQYFTTQNIKTAGLGDLIVILTDHDGRPILPDLEAARSFHDFAHGLPGVNPNKLTFTFDSPLYPWSAEELDTLSTALGNFYPAAESIYGQPAFNITVNVRKDPTISFSGEYSPTMNEIVLRDASQLDVLCHEMIHAFRDDDMITINNYEEGMTRAVEVEVFNRLAAYTFWNENHGYMYDVYYDGLNRQVVGSQSGNFDYASPFLLLRYELTGYAWAKVFFENLSFFIDFNRTLYHRTILEPSTRTDESKLREIAASLQPTVEGKPFLTWYEQQGILYPVPPAGYNLYQNISNFNVYYFYRDSAGSESMQPDTIIYWEVYDYLDGFVDSGSDVTSLLGWISIHPVFPADYKGRIKIVASVLSPGGMISNIALRSIGNDNGIFGITADTDSGSVSFIPLDDPSSLVNVDVINGAFSAPSLAAVRGRFTAIYTDNEGETFSKCFNKDASDYFLPMVKSAATTDLSISQTSSPDPVAAGSNLTSTVIVANNGPDSANEVVLTDILPNDVTLVSAAPAQGNCVFSTPSIICNLNTLPSGSSTTVDIVLTSSLPGSIRNVIRVTGNVSDPDTTNNIVIATSTVVDIFPRIMENIVLLIDEIDDFVDLGIFNQGQGNSLIAILKAVRMQAENGKTNMMPNQLHAFIEHADAFVKAGILSQPQGDELITMAEDIIALLQLQKG